MAETGAAETGAAETGATETRAAETGAAETGAAETGAAETGAAETRAAETGAAETGAAETRAAGTRAAGTRAAAPANNLILFGMQEYDPAANVRCYHHLIDIAQSYQDKAAMEQGLVNHVNNTIRLLEQRSRRKIELMYIGKANVDKNGDSEYFDHMDPTTWTTDGIASRWIAHKNKYYAQGGMVVLCVFTEDHLPVGSRRSQEFLALAMEQRLIHHFQIFDTEKVLVNETFNSGKTTVHTKDAWKLSISIEKDHADLDLTSREPVPNPKYCAYVIYMTFTYLPPKVEWKGLREKQEKKLKEQKESDEKKARKKEEEKKQKKDKKEPKKEEEKKQKQDKKKTSEIEELRKLFHKHKHKSFVICNIVVVHVNTFCY